ncbi:MAG: HDOD domain-containing protein, partial [Candidatus Hydrogenedentes bacterium]|nr:HDOD domain-containing protein [Candidatus Hydrogenedentota bacterium]
MNALDLKRQITLGQRLSPLPEAAVLLLRLQHPTPSLQAALVHLATSDPDLAAELFAGVGLSPGEGTLPEAIARLDISALRRIVFRCTLPRLFPHSDTARLDRQEFWRHAIATATLGEAFARRVGNSWIDHVYVACLIHDMGKLILDDAMPEQYARARERTRTEAMFALEAERREMGVDHTLAGKWLAEAWRLPDEYVAAVWFHHHPVGGLDETDYPVGLIDLVALADQLVYENRLGAASAGDAAERDARVQRLGLGEEEVEEIIRDADQRRQQRVPVIEGASRGLVPRANPQNVDRKLHRLGILSNLHLQFEPGITEEQVMQALAAAVREAFLVSSGSIVLVGEGGATRGYLWKSVTGQLERFEYPAALSGDAAEDPFLRLVRALGASDEGASAAMTTIPILGQGQRLGHVIFDAGRSDLGNRQEDYDELVAFARAGGNALLYARAEAQLRQRTEELAASLW